jgi:hypothetical protein
VVLQQRVGARAVERRVGEQPPGVRGARDEEGEEGRDGAALAEINAGSRDGVKAGWVLAVGDGSTFVGNLRITEVDVNRSVGVIELEDAGSRGEVKVGQRAVARAGE